jgi:GT2 family glycosyltransferase
MIKIAVIILNFNGFSNTIECIESFSKAKLFKNSLLELIVVDNGSSDNSAVHIRKQFPKTTLIENQTNLGFSGGNNEGMRYAIKGGAEYVIVLNNDTIADASLLEHLIKTAESSETIGAVVPKIYFEKGYEFHKDKYKKNETGRVIWYAGGVMDWENLIGENRGVDEVDNGQFNEPEETELATGCCILLKPSVLNKVGLFDDKYFLYYEDADLSERIKKAGFKIIYEPKAVLWHKNAESSGGSGSDLQDYYITRNRLLFGMTYAPIRTKFALFRESLRILKSGRKWQRNGATDFYIGRFGRGSFPI